MAQGFRSIASHMTVKALMSERFSNLVVPLAHEATAMRIADNSGSSRDRSGAVAPLIGASLRRGDVDSTNDSTPPIRPMPGFRTSATATRITTTRAISTERVLSAEKNTSPLADFSFEDLVVAYFDCRRNKRNTHNALAFEAGMERNLCALYDELKDGTYKPTRSICFVITRPKRREVWAAHFRDRVVHHLLYNRVAPRFHRAFIADSCACIPGRGTLYAAKRLEHKIRSASQNWSRQIRYLKCDLANFFVSIDKPTLLAQLARRIHEAWWLKLAELILFHDPRPNATFHSSPSAMALIPPHKSLLGQPAHLGLPIGNLSSQFFANVLLDDLDQFVKHDIGARHYVRYVDDFILLHESAQWLNDAHRRIAEFLPGKLKLRLNESKTIKQPVERGVDFVGHLIRPWCRTVRKRTVNEATRRMSTIEPWRLFETANSYLGLMRQSPHSHAVRARMAKLIRLRGHAVDMGCTKAYR